MLSKRLVESVKRHEGLRLASYVDSEGVWTIGYGHNLESHGLPKQYQPYVVIDRDTAERWLRQDIMEARREAEQFAAYHALDTRARRDVFIELVFNMGAGTLAQFKKALTAMEAGDWQQAAAELLDSKWRRQVKGRALTLATLMEVGKYHETP